MKKLSYFSIDDVSLPFRHNVFLTINKPEIIKESVLKPSEYGSGKPDDVAAHFYGTVLYDDGKYRMWYYACHKGLNPDLPPEMMRQTVKMPPWGWDLLQGPLCYAESEDGINWVKPVLNQFKFKGNTLNNAILLPHTIVSGPTLIKDEGDKDPARRYKMIYQYFPEFSEPLIEEYGNISSVAMAVSPDGLNWTMTATPFINQFTEHCSFMKHDGKYILHYHTIDDWNHLAEGGTYSGRIGVARVSPDFDYWPDIWAETFALPEPADRSKRGAAYDYDQVHLGVGAVSFGNVSIGLYGLWHNANFDTFMKISGDLGLLISNDGIHFREPAKGHVFIHRDESPATVIEGHDYNTILCQTNGILNVGEKTLIYHGRWRNAGENHLDESIKHYGAEVGLATLSLDRWGGLSLIPGSEKGVVLSCLTELSGDDRISLNADGLANIKVSLLDENFRPIPGFENAGAQGCCGFNAKVEWEGRLSNLAGRKVYIQITMHKGESDPKLYAIYAEGK